jgi:GxxExxY protein
LGAGFLERVYERALLKELGIRGIRAAAQGPFDVTYKGQSVGEYFADILVEQVLVVVIAATASSCERSFRCAYGGQ